MEYVQGFPLRTDTIMIEKVPRVRAVVCDFFNNAQEEIGDVSAALMVWRDGEITAELFIKFENLLHATTAYQFFNNNYYEGELLLKSWMVAPGRELEADEERAYARVVKIDDQGEVFFVETYDMGPRKKMTAESSAIMLSVSSDTANSVKPDAKSDAAPAESASAARAAGTSEPTATAPDTRENASKAAKTRSDAPSEATAASNTTGRWQFYNRRASKHLCAICKSPYHVQALCPTVTCLRCGDPGHMSSLCRLPDTRRKK